MKKIYLIIIVVIFVLVIGGIYYVLRSQKSAPVQSENQPNMRQQISREEIMNDFSQKIGEVSPAKPVLGGSWYITRFWFIQESNKDFYAEYEDGHIMARVLIETEKNNTKLDYKVVAYFEPGENDWILKKGEDKFSGALFDLYEHSEELDQWIKKN